MVYVPEWRDPAVRRNKFTWKERAERLSAWRRHPFYAFNMRVMFPGLGIGAALFSGYMVGKQFLPGSGGHH